MKKIAYLTGSLATLALPMVAGAQGITKAGGNLGGFEIIITNITNAITTYLLPFVLALAFIAFAWGMFQYFIAGGANEEAKEKGKSLMIYGVLGFVMILILWGLVNFLVNFTGLGGDVVVPPVVPKI
ncbi:MAG: hypothetical protein KC877_04750 [Candidatus Kaiserbacteria bacterium]|nr:hypothetical protein [Candidatus Kaiserbacteria bacterium]MCB9815769.1 hypothetical protein [Candidatus Nomurabacteria bacterium]